MIKTLNSVTKLNSLPREIISHKIYFGHPLLSSLTVVYCYVQLMMVFLVCWSKPRGINQTRSRTPTHEPHCLSIECNRHPHPLSTGHPWAVDIYSAHLDLDVNAHRQTQPNRNPSQTCVSQFWIAQYSEIHYSKERV